LFPHSWWTGAGIRAMAGLPQIIEKAALFDTILVTLGGRDDVGAGEPAVEIDVAAARRAERTHLFCRRPVADRTTADRLGGSVSEGVWRLVWHHSFI
jgi:hypothetical protein